MDCLRVNANFTGCTVDLATWTDLCYRVWQLWRQKINRITRSFMKADLAGKTGEHMAGQVLSRSDRYWQWLYLGCAEIPFHHQQSAPRRAAPCHGCQVPRSPAHPEVVGAQQSIALLRTRSQQGNWRPTVHPLLKRVKRWPGTSLRNMSTS